MTLISLSFGEEAEFAQSPVSPVVASPARDPEDEEPGGSHDQADAKWIVIRIQLRGHNDTPFGRIFVSQHIVFGSL